MTDASQLLLGFSGWMTVALIVILGFIVLLGLVNAVVVIWRTLRSGRQDAEGGKRHPLPEGLLGMDQYLHVLADVLLVVVGIELIDTLIAFLDRANPQVYLSGVIGAGLVALARRVIVFFQPENGEQFREMLGYAALVVALALAYWVVRTVA